MKKLLFVILTISVLLLAACGKDDQASSPKEGTTENQKLKVASLIPPMTDILDVAKPILKKEGIDLEVVVLSDNVQPNTALATKEVDANLFQHQPFMKEYNKANDANLVAIQKIYYPNYSIYSKKYDSWDAIPKGAKVAIANDPSNIDRTLQLLAQNKVITLGEKKDTYYTMKDIKSNPKEIKFKEVDLLMLARTYDEVDAVALYPAYASPLGLTPSKDAILQEKPGNDYAIQLVTRDDNKDDEAIQKLKKALTSDEVREYLEKNFKETSIPAF